MRGNRRQPRLEGFVSRGTEKRVLPTESHKREADQFQREWAFQEGGSQKQYFEVFEVADFGRDRALQRGGSQMQDFEVPKVAEFGRD